MRTAPSGIASLQGDGVGPLLQRHHQKRLRLTYGRDGMPAFSRSSRGNDWYAGGPPCRPCRRPPVRLGHPRPTAARAGIAAWASRADPTQCDDARFPRQIVRRTCFGSSEIVSRVCVSCGAADASVHSAPYGGWCTG